MATFFQFTDLFFVMKVTHTNDEDHEVVGIHVPGDSSKLRKPTECLFANLRIDFFQCCITCFFNVEFQFTFFTVISQMKSVNKILEICNHFCPFCSDNNIKQHRKFIATKPSILLITNSILKIVNNKMLV